MRTETIERKIYTWKELSEDIKEKAIEKLYDINVDHDWWDFIYEDAANIGLKITEFDIGRGSYCHAELTEGIEDVRKAILKHHGPTCDTYKLAEQYEGKLLDEEGDENEDEVADFLNSLLEEYRCILQKECEYLTSEEAIIGTIEANEYEFDENGDIA